MQPAICSCQSLLLGGNNIRSFFRYSEILEHSAVISLLDVECRMLNKDESCRQKLGYDFREMILSFEVSSSRVFSHIRRSRVKLNVLKGTRHPNPLLDCAALGSLQKD